MGKKCFEINGGATVPRRLERFRLQKVLGLAAMVLLMHASVVFAQGSIFGVVQNSNLTTPANGEISFYGFTDNTDDEIRLESSIGAGYDAGNWFDDFQNFLSKTPGNPYMYRFYNTANGEGAVLSKTIPNNSFQQEDIALGAIAWPAAPGGMAARIVSSTSVVLTWTRTTGQTYHVYRRAATSQGSFFRLDNPAGLLTAAGVADSFFVDNTASGGGSFQYLLIAQDGSGNLGPHSSILTVSTGTIAAPLVTSITPNNGSGLGGTAVVIQGIGFDVNGATATIGGAALTSVTVVSPFQINGVTPAGSGTADVVVQNTSSALSATLTGGYAYLGNQPPILAAIGPRSVDEGVNLNFVVTATDADGTTPIMTTTTPLPTNATFVDNGNGTGTFNFDPTFAQAGTYNVTFYASDGTVIDSEQVVITVNNVNQAPVLAAIGARSVDEGANLNFAVSATDPDGTTPVMTATTPLPANATFVDNGNGTGTFNFNPSFAQAGAITVTFYATDGVIIDSEQVVITVNNINQAPVLATIGARSTTEQVNLTFAVSAADADGAIPVLTTSTLPTSATFVDNGNGTGTFSFTPSFTQAGVYSITFRASDGVAIDSEIVTVTVVDAGNQTPVLAAIGPRGTTETVNLTFVVSATDADATIPTLTTSSLPTNATFVDNGDGNGTFSFTPSFTQAGTYPIVFRASDGVAIDSEIVTITVAEAGNQAPVLAAIGAQSTVENTILTFSVSATDADGTIPLFTTSVLPANATFVDNGNGTGTFSFTPSFTQAGSYPITFRASDGVAIDSEIVTITVVEAGNQTPVLASIGPRGTTEGVLLSFTATATDPDATTPVLTSSALPANATFVDNGDGTGTFNFTPSFTQAGTYPVTFYASDGTAIDSEIVTITVADASNQTPILAAIGPRTTDENVNLSFTVSATDPDGTTPILTTTVLPANATFVDNLNGTGSFSFTPDFTQAGAINVTFYASDGVAIDSEIVTITVTDVNRAPIMTAISAQTVDEGQVLAVAVTAADPDGAIPVLTTSALPLNATFVDNLDGTGTFNFSPDFTQAGPYSVTFRASDGVLADSQVVAITVNEVNRAPVLAAIGPRSVAAGDVLNFVVSASDPDGSIPTLATSTLPANATFVDNADGTGTVNFAPTLSQAGQFVINFTASDGALQASELVAINVTLGGNAIPVWTAVPDTAIDEGTTMVLNVTAVDPDGAGVFPALSVSTSLLHYTFVDHGDGTGTLTYTPDYYDAGIDSVRFFAVDFGTPPQTSVEIARITTNDVNRPPVFAALTNRTVESGRLLSFAVAASDSTDPLWPRRVFLSASGLPTGASFIDSGNNTGAFSFAPTAAQVGTYNVTFLAVDQGVPSQSATAIVQITVTTANSAPTMNLAANEARIVTEGQTLTVSVVAADPDGTTPTITAEDMPANATLVQLLPGEADFVFTPDYVQGGARSKLYAVTIKATDGLATVKSVVAIQVNDAGDQAPVFDSLPVSPSVTEGQTLTLRVRASDPDTLDVTLSAVTATLPTNASFVDSGDGLGVITFAPNYMQAGVYNVDINAYDGTLTTTGTISITVVEAGNQPPVLAEVADRTIREMQAFLFNVTATDPDGDIPILYAAPLPVNAVFTDYHNGSGTFDWVTNNFDSGHYTITFYAEDATDNTVIDSQQVTFIVLDTNLAPGVFTSGPRSIFEADTLYYVVTATDPDSTIPLIRATLDLQDTLATNMVFVDSGNGVGVLRFIPSYSQGGTTSISYFVRFYAKDVVDTTLVTAALSSVSIRVSNRNAPPELAFSPGTGPFTIPEGDSVKLSITTSDPDGGLPTVTATGVPANATFTSGALMSNFRFLPDFTQAGTYTVRFTATDAAGAATSQDIVIDVTEAGNQPPQFTITPLDTLNIAANLSTRILIQARDPEHGAVTIAASPIVSSAAFVDSGNGSATYTITPSIADIGSTVAVSFTVTDQLAATSTATTSLRVVAFLRGDIDQNGRYTLVDLAALVAYLLRSGPPPAIMQSGDVNADGIINLTDLTYLIAFLYGGGNQPPQ